MTGGPAMSSWAMIRTIGGGHLPDYNVYAPVFDDKGELVLIQALQAHQGDTGGKDPGGFTLEATISSPKVWRFPA